MNPNAVIVVNHDRNFFVWFKHVQILVHYVQIFAVMQDTGADVINRNL